MRLLLLIVLLLPAGLCAQATFDSLQLIDSRTVYFDFGGAELRPEADSSLREIAALAVANPGSKIHLTAHTDAVGTDLNNKQLSDARAESVRAALAARGLADSVLVIETFGEQAPVAGNDSEAGRQLNRRVSMDLYRQRRMRYLDGQIRDQISGDGIPATVILRGKEFRDSLATDSIGRFRHPVPDNEVIGIDAFARDYFFETKMLKVQPDLKLDIPLAPARTGETADINNLYFVGGQAVLVPQSEPELPKVLRFMEVNPHLRIEIAGHVNVPNQPTVSENSWEWGLSVARAKLVHDYLLQHGIDSSRVSFQGYGNSQMRFPNATSQKEQALNRRVEIRVLGSQ